MSTSLELERDLNDLRVWPPLHAGKMDLDLGAEVQSMWKPISGGRGGGRAVQRSKRWEGVLTWAEADGHSPWNTHFWAFSIVFCALRSFARLAQLFCVLSGLFGPLKCTLCLRVGRAESYSLIVRRGRARKRLPPLAARSGVRAGYPDRGLCRSC